MSNAGTQHRVQFSWIKLLLWTSLLTADVLFVSHAAGLYVAAVVAVSVASITVMRRILGLGAAYLTAIPIGAVGFYCALSGVGGPPEDFSQVLEEVALCLAFGAAVGGPIALGITCLLQFFVDHALTEIRRPQFRLRTVFVVLTLLSLVMGYAGAYYRLSRRGMKEAATYGMHGFLYVSMDKVMASEDLSTQLRWCAFFAPANWVDRHVFGGPAPVTEILFHIS